MTYLHCPGCRMTVYSGLISGVTCPRCRGQVGKTAPALFDRPAAMQAGRVTAGEQVVGNWRRPLNGEDGLRL